MMEFLCQWCFPFMYILEISIKKKKNRIKEVKHIDSVKINHKITKNISAFQFPGLRFSAVGLGSPGVQFHPTYFIGFERVKSTLFYPVLVHP